MLKCHIIYHVNSEKLCSKTNKATKNQSLNTMTNNKLMLRIVPRARNQQNIMSSTLKLHSFFRLYQLGISYTFLSHTGGFHCGLCKPCGPCRPCGPCGPYGPKMNLFLSMATKLKLFQFWTLSLKKNQSHFFKTC